MIYTSNTELPEKEEGKDYCFLAGSIDLDLSGNWRKAVIEEINDSMHFFDPTRTDHNKLNDTQMKEHIKWELDALNLSDRILLNFLPNAKSPISLAELGMYVRSSKLMVVCPDQFYQRRYVGVLCDKYDTPFFDSLEEAVKHLKDNIQTRGLN